MSDRIYRTTANSAGGDPDDDDEHDGSPGSCGAVALDHLYWQRRLERRSISLREAARTGSRWAKGRLQQLQRERRRMPESVRGAAADLVLAGVVTSTEITEEDVAFLDFLARVAVEAALREADMLDVEGRCTPR